jgi:hypothetical protein
VKETFMLSNITVAVTVVALFASSALSQPAVAPSAAPGAATSTPAASSAAPVSQQELDQLLAPIALYPDALLAQVLMASTYPLEVVEAARWSKANPGVSDKALEDAMQQQRWDPSVKALTAVPTVLQQMSDKLEWTQKLGDAFLAQQSNVMATVQNLRARAQAAGNLQSTAEQQVRTEVAEGKTVYVIEPAKPQVVYVPTYNPYTIYGTWWYPVPPYYMYPPAYVYPPGLAFATGVFVGAAIWGHCDWRYGSVNININSYNQFNRTTINNVNWNHDAAHRGGVAYRDQGVASKYNRGGDERAAQAREQFRGRVDSAGGAFSGAGLDGSGAGLSGARDAAGRLDRPNAGDLGARGGAGAGDFNAGSRARSAGGFDGGGASTRVGGAFDGAGAGASVRGASARGGASRAGMGGAGMGGGGRRR